VEAACVYSGARRKIAAASFLPVTARLPNDKLWRALRADPQALADSGIAAVTPIGDCLAPATIAHAVYAGHRFAREFDDAREDGVPFRRELVTL
ncbi:MAG TPA: NADH:flavin oxidoreductase, partial [Kiloniellaceae bacterium]|nr:NADH:flavin oxidoreductase [Kiloniellaceae bacterium]